jgi:hypothetical protein
MNDRHLLHRGIAALALGTLLIAAPACAAPRGRLYVRVAPPGAVVERVPVAPGPRYVWVPGYYRWDGRGYLWAPGAYVLPPRPRARWVPGRWAHERGGWYWMEGRWR